MNVFYDDWINLGDADDAFGSKADNHLKVETEYELLLNSFVFVILCSCV